MESLEPDVISLNLYGEETVKRLMVVINESLIRDLERAKSTNSAEAGDYRAYYMVMKKYVIDDTPSDSKSNPRSIAYA